MIWDTIANIPAPQLLAFILGGLALNFAPGQDVFFASACGIQAGPRAGALAGFGVGLGVLFHLTLATVGLGTIVAAHPEAMTAIKYAGAAYLLYLAWKSWTAGPVQPQAQGARRPWNIIRRGALSNILNPKPVLFLLAFLGYGVVAGYVGHMLGKRLGLLNKIAAVMFAGLAIRLVAK